MKVYNEKMIVQEWGMALSAVAEELMGRVDYRSIYGIGDGHLKCKPKGYLKKKRAKRRMCKNNSNKRNKRR